jgi:hypothetical protein
VGQLGHLSDQLHPGRPGSDHHERQPLAPLLRVGGQLGHLERGQDVAAQMPGVFKGLHARRELRELVAAEVGVRRAASNHQHVVRQYQLPPVRGDRMYHLVVQVHVRDLG